MIYPTASELLQLIDKTLLAASDVTMPRMDVKSALATTRHLVRHVELRQKLERSILLDDIDKAGELLGSVAVFFESTGAENTALTHNIRAALKDAPQLLSKKPDEMDNIINRAKALRELIYTSLARLQGFSTEQKTAERYVEIRRLMREYMTSQLRQEATMVTPAFLGHGPRR